jgi:chromosomal replication initiation ATPase DnaA
MEGQIILHTIAKALGYTVEEISSKGKKTSVLFARYIAIAILKEEGLKSDQIALLFSNFTRNVIANHCKEVFNDLINYNRTFKDMYLLAVKAVEDLEYESENESPAA